MAHEFMDGSAKLYLFEAQSSPIRGALSSYPQRIWLFEENPWCCSCGIVDENNFAVMSCRETSHIAQCFAHASFLSSVFRPRNCVPYLRDLCGWRYLLCRCIFTVYDSIIYFYFITITRKIANSAVNSLLNP